MEATTVKSPPERPSLPDTSDARRGRKPRSSEPVARYFLQKDGSSPAKPELGEEAQNESEALIKAFQSKGGVIYVVMSFKAEAEIQGNNPVLVKRPLQR
jgi:hypothetical protein